jgi:hypothetical protein
MPASVRSMPRPATGKTFTARARIPRPSWDAFERNVGENNRSAWVKDFVEGLNREPQLWLDAKRIADLRGELLWTVVGRALARYVARHKHLIEDDAE